MRSIPFAPIILAMLIGAVLLVLLVLHRPSTAQTIVFSNLTTDQTQTVFSATHPTALEWRVDGEIQGTGTVTIGNHFFLNRLTGRISTNGTGDWYTTNATVVFSPNQPAKGKIQVYLRFVGVP